MSEKLVEVVALSTSDGYGFVKEGLEYFHVRVGSVNKYEPVTEGAALRAFDYGFVAYTKSFPSRAEFLDWFRAERTRDAEAYLAARLNALLKNNDITSDLRTRIENLLNARVAP